MPCSATSSLPNCDDGGEDNAMRGAYVNSSPYRQCPKRDCVLRSQSAVVLIRTPGVFHSAVGFDSARKDDETLPLF